MVPALLHAVMLASTSKRGWRVSTVRSPAEGRDWTGVLAPMSATRALETAERDVSHLKITVSLPSRHTGRGPTHSATPERT
jgi:hypothetical protein